MSIRLDDAIIRQLEVQNAGKFIYSGIQQASTNSARPVWFSNNSGPSIPVYSDTFKYNPSTRSLELTPASDTNSAYLKTTTGILSIKSASTLYLDRGSNCSLIFQLAGAENARFDTSGNFRPKEENLYNIGNSTYPWKDIYARRFLVSAEGRTYAYLNANTLGTTTTTGIARLSLGNNLASGTEKNAKGQILLYGQNTGYLTINTNVGTGTPILYLRDHGKTAYTVGTPNTSAVGGSTHPVYVDSSGIVTACGSLWTNSDLNSTSEFQVGTTSAAGKIYLYSQSTSTGNRGIYSSNNAEEQISILTVTKDNVVSLNGSAKKLETGRTLKVALNSTNVSAAFDGTNNVHNIGVSGTLAVSNGGTGTATAPVAGGVIYGASTSAYGCTAVGTSGQLLQSAGTGKPTWITATNSNIASTIVKRDSSGNFSAGTITAALSGNASTATKLQTARKINSVSFDGSANITFKGNYVSNTSYGSLPVGISYIEMPSTATVSGDPTYGVMLTTYYNSARAFQLVGTNNNNLSFRCLHSNLSSDAGTGYGVWNKILHSNNYTSYTVTKTGTGASGTWGISVTGSAATLYNSSAGTLTWSGDHMLSSSARPNAKLHFGTDTLYQYRNSTYYIILDSGNYTSYTVTKTGSGASGTWGISITGNADTATVAGYTTRWDIEASNPTTTSTDNSTGYFNKAGSHIYWYYTNGLLNGQPSTYGYLLDIGNYSERHQIWMTQNTGSLLHRGGNAGGWSSEGWRTILDSNNYSSYALPLNGGTVYGTVTINNGNSSGYLQLSEDGEGGTIRMAGPNASYIWEMDSYNNSTFRIFTNGSGSYKFFVFDGASGAFSAPSVYGAVWNDYAEYRSQTEELKPGHVAYCDNDGKLRQTTSRLQKFEGVVSDTFGFAIGKTEEAKTPLAVSGRVLVYTYEDRNTFNSGDCVCAGPNGRVCKMTREEIAYYPDKIVGIVSEIPEYDTWGTGKVNVDGRIWIKVK